MYQDFIYFITRICKVCFSNTHTSSQEKIRLTFSRRFFLSNNDIHIIDSDIQNSHIDSKLR